jgi:hypothetical protein
MVYLPPVSAALRWMMSSQPKALITWWSDGSMMQVDEID